MIQSEVRAEIEEMLTSGMKSAGDRRPRVGWRQRTSASAPSSLPSLSRICGW